MGKGQYANSVFRVKFLNSFNNVHNYTINVILTSARNSLTDKVIYRSDYKKNLFMSVGLKHLTAGSLKYRFRKHNSL